MKNLHAWFAAELFLIAFVLETHGANPNWQQYFDSVSVPNLPAGWSTTADNLTNPECVRSLCADPYRWKTFSASPVSAPNAAGVSLGGGGDVKISSLTSPTLSVSGSAQLAFRHAYGSGLRGQLLVKIGTTGQFINVKNTGWGFSSGGYNDTNGYWQGTQGNFVPVSLNIPSSLIGQSITFMWRAHGSSGVWYVDNVEVSGAAETPYWWSQSVSLGSGWRWLSWMGFLNVSWAPWVYHEFLGWMYAPSISPDSMFIWTQDMGWLWTSRAVYSYFWRFQDNSWIYYQLRSVNPRWFYNMGTGRWERRM
jgi:hypothetical protein